MTEKWENVIKKIVFNIRPEARYVWLTISSWFVWNAAVGLLTLRPNLEKSKVWTEEEKM